MKLEIGNEERFSEFIKGLNEKDKICLLSHTDLDGIASAVVTNKIIDADALKFINYDDMNDELAEILKVDGYNKIILTDLLIAEHPDFLKKLESFAEILMLDHHPSGNMNSSRCVHLKVEDGYCAGYLCYEMFRKIKDIEKLDWLVACSCISDFCHVKPEDWLRKIYSKYGDEYERDGIYVRKSGKMWDLQWNLSLALIYFKENLKKVYDSIGEDFGEVGDLNKYAGEVQKEIDNVVSGFDDGKKEFNGGYYFEFEPRFGVASICSNVLSSSRVEMGKTLVMLRFDGDYCSVSFRNQAGDVNVAELAKKLVEGLENAGGGGHAKAAGARIMRKDLDEFKKRLGVRE